MKRVYSVRVGRGLEQRQFYAVATTASGATRKAMAQAKRDARKRKEKSKLKWRLTHIEERVGDVLL